MYSNEQVRQIIKSYFPLDRIGRGTYGEIYSLDNSTVLKKQSLFENSNSLETFNSMALREICALSQFQHPYMIKLKNIKILKNEISFEMEKCICLPHWLNKNVNIKFSLLPKLVSQLVELLYYYEKINKIHGDLSANNITIDNKNDIKVIDYGSFMFNPLMIEENMCTYSFRAPELQEIPEKTVFLRTCKSDIFSLGMIIKYIIFGTCDCETSIKKYEINKYDEYKSDHNLVSNLIDKDFILLWRKMLKIDPNKRISAKDLFNSLYFTNIRKTYSKKSSNSPLTSTINTFKNRLLLKNFKNTKFLDINQEMRKILITWMYEVCSEYKIKNCLGLSVHILDLYLSKNPNISRKKLQCLGCACLILSVGLLIGKDSVFSDYTYMSDNSFTIKKLKNVIKNVLLTLNFNLYYKTFDQHIDNIDHINMTFIYYDHNNTGKTNKELLFIYNLLNKTTVSDWVLLMKSKKMLI